MEPILRPSDGLMPVKTERVIGCATVEQSVAFVFAGSLLAVVHHAICIEMIKASAFSSSETISRRSGTKARPRLPSPLPASIANRGWLPAK